MYKVTKRSDRKFAVLFRRRFAFQAREAKITLVRAHSADGEKRRNGRRKFRSTERGLPIVTIVPIVVAERSSLCVLLLFTDQ